MLGYLGGIIHVHNIVVVILRVFTTRNSLLRALGTGRCAAED
jgi:hypothetical protein